MAIFKRNLTSKLIESSAISCLIDGTPRKVLEVGCGDANITRTLYAQFPDNSYYASDISNEAIQAASSHPAMKAVSFRQGSLFEPWKNLSFDLIISDVASISSEIADLSDWYIGVECDSGVNGLKLVSQIIEQVPELMSRDGIFIIPLLSLSAHDLLLRKLQAQFGRVDITNLTTWPLPEKLAEQINLAQLSLKTENWNIANKFGILTANTSVAICRK